MANSPLWNREEGRLRAPWRLTIGLVLSAIGLIAVALGLLALFRFDPVALESADRAVQALVVIGPGVALTAAVLLAARYVDRRRLPDLGFRVDGAWWRDLVFGLFLGGLLMTVVFAVEYALGWVTVVGLGALTTVDVLTALGLGLAVFLAVGVYEELFARGYLLTNVAEGLSGYAGRGGAVAVATLLSALVFGALHAGNPNATALSTLAISLAGVMLAAGYVFTGELAIPIGIHITWNVFQGLVYGFPVSGLGLQASVVRIDQGGPTRYTGGAFGPEAGLIGVGAIVLGTLLLLAWVRYTHGLFVDPEVTRPALRRRSGGE